MASERLKLSEAWLTSMEAVATDDHESQDVTHVVPAAMLDLIAEIRASRASRDELARLVDVIRVQARGREVVPDGVFGLIDAIDCLTKEPSNG